MLTFVTAFAPAAAAARPFNDLVHTLVAKPQCRGDLAQRRSAQVQTTNGAMEVCPCALRQVLGLDQTLLGASRLCFQVHFGRHSSIVPRRLTIGAFEFALMEYSNLGAVEQHAGQPGTQSQAGVASSFARDRSLAARHHG